MAAYVFFILSLGLTSANALFFGNLLAQEKWNGFKVTWGPNPLSSHYFNTMPRTASDALKQGFKKISDCDLKANWRGARYVKDNDIALVLLFDVNGYIAGIQTTVPGGLDYPKINLQPPFVKDGNNWVISAYFVDPSIICTSGRSASDFGAQGTGTNLYIQNGTVAEKDRILIPHQETGMSSTKWTKGKCFYTMGLHFWYNLSDDMSCDDFFPVFLLFNNGQLNGFGWAMTATLNSTRLEHPSQSTFGLFMESVPKCLLNAGTISTMHVYLTESIIKDLC